MDASSHLLIGVKHDAQLKLVRILQYEMKNHGIIDNPSNTCWEIELRTKNITHGSTERKVKEP